MVGFATLRGDRSGATAAAEPGYSLAAVTNARRRNSFTRSLRGIFLAAIEQRFMNPHPCDVSHRLGSTQPTHLAPGLVLGIED